MTYPLGGLRRATPVRLSVGRELGRDIDGAWWPRVDRITVELPNLVATLTPLLGDITSINVNWPPLQRPPDFNWPGWEAQAPARDDRQRRGCLCQPADHPVRDLQRTRFDGAALRRQSAHRRRRPRQTRISNRWFDPAGRRTTTQSRELLESRQSGRYRHSRLTLQPPGNVTAAIRFPRRRGSSSDVSRQFGLCFRAPEVPLWVQVQRLLACLTARRWSSLYSRHV